MTATLSNHIQEKKIGGGGPKMAKKWANKKLPCEKMKKKEPNQQKKIFILVS